MSSRKWLLVVLIFLIIFPIFFFFFFLSDWVYWVVVATLVLDFLFVFGSAEGESFKKSWIYVVVMAGIFLHDGYLTPKAFSSSSETEESSSDNVSSSSDENSTVPYADYCKYCGGYLKDDPNKVLWGQGRYMHKRCAEIWRSNESAKHALGDEEYEKVKSTISNHFSGY